ncbi:uncharacterized protein LOC130753186 isoform X2 [Actinidia eriantha]|uniref:uncharacterized protein LOC130753186 isoform X2 n=1 Tax=Actinidia eriantha TaxID=165200 RepID=UPI0025902E32|nr:uncharacterized protein LOC130753186 isoform X2 [Actinidia eriantha]
MATSWQWVARWWRGFGGLRDVASLCNGSLSFQGIIRHLQHMQVVTSFWQLLLHHSMHTIPLFCIPEDGRNTRVASLLCATFWDKSMYKWGKLFALHGAV